MPIQNSVYKGKKLSVSEFFCPKCFVIQPYHLKPMSPEIMFYPIATLATNEPTHVVECEICRNAFDLEILNRNIQRLLRLAGAAKNQIDQGVFPEHLKARLLRDGVEERFADELITLARH